MSEFEKKKIYEDFRELNSEIRILCSTDAMGLDMNIKDVDIVVQWQNPPSLRALMQRAGRVARNAERTGEFIWLHPRWCKEAREGISSRRPRHSQLSQVMSIDIADVSNSETEEDETTRKIQAERQKARSKTDLERRAVMKDSLWRMINESSCIRIMILQTLNEPNLINVPRHYETGCCSNCNPTRGSTSQIESYRKLPFKPPRAKAPSHVRRAVEVALKKWRDEKGTIEFEDSILVQDCNYEIFLSDKRIKNITRNAHLMTLKNLRLSINDWHWLEKYEEELTALITFIAENARKQDRPEKSIVSIIFEHASQINTLASEMPVSHSADLDSTNLEIVNSTNTVSRPLTPEPRVIENLRSPRPRRKRQASVPKDSGSPLRSRNASPSMRDLMSEELRFGQNSNKPRRDSAIRSDIARKQNLDLLRR